MPRRRMLDPDFWNDARIKRLSPTERLLFIGMISHADDDGRLLAAPAFLRSKVFPYDDFSLEDIQTMRDHIVESNPNLELYQNSGEDYLYLRKWARYQKPSHPQPSKLPPPPNLQESVHESVQEPVQELVQEQVSEEDQPKAGDIPSQVRSGQSSQGQVRLGQVRAVQEDFTKFSDESDLTDLLATTLTNQICAGRRRMVERGLGGGGPGNLTPQQDATIRSQWGVVVLERFWSQRVGKMSTELFEGSLQALKKYPLKVVAKAFTKAARYKGGTYHKWKYIQTILDEEMEKGAHGERAP